MRPATESHGRTPTSTDLRGSSLTTYWAPVSELINGTDQLTGAGDAAVDVTFSDPAGGSILSDELGAGALPIHVHYPGRRARRSSGVLSRPEVHRVPGRDGHRRRRRDGQPAQGVIPNATAPAWSPYTSTPHRRRSCIRRARRGSRYRWSRVLDPGTVRASGFVKIAHVRGQFALHPGQATLAAGSARTLRLAVPIGPRVHIVSALRHRARVTATVTVRFTATQGGIAPAADDHRPDRLTDMESRLSRGASRISCLLLVC